MRKAIGPGIRLMTDVNCAWTLGTAIQWGKRLEEFDVFWLEEPRAAQEDRASVRP